MSILSDSFKSGKYVYDALNINENNISKGTPSLNMVKEVIKNHFKLSVISKMVIILISILANLIMMILLKR